jgi:hypothetical protein
MAMMNIILIDPEGSVVDSGLALECDTRPHAVWMWGLRFVPEEEQLHEEGPPTLFYAREEEISDGDDAEAV